MKKIICFSLLLIISVASFCQQTTTVTPTLTKADYLQKSKNQNSTAWVLLSGGTTLITVGLLIGDNKNASFGDAGTGIIMGGLGFLSTLGSIPLFIASGKNKRKANAATVFFKMEKIAVIQQTGFASRSYPIFSLRISL